MTSLAHIASPATAALTSAPDVDATRADVDAAVLDTPEAQPNSGPPREIGGREGLDPTRYGDWELRGRCIDF